MRTPAILTAVVSSVAASLLFTSTARAQDMQPPPPAPAPPQNATDADLQKSEKEDSGLGLEWIYLNGGGGFSYINLKSFSESQLALETTSKSGGMYTFGAGVRLLFLTLGLRATNHTAWNLWQLNGEVGFHMKVSRIDGYLAAHGGYDTVGSFSQSISNSQAGISGAPATVDVHGWNAGLGLGLDYYFTSLISLGAEVSGDVLFISRPPAPLPTVDQLPQSVKNQIPPGTDPNAYIKDKIGNNPMYANSGSSVGFGAAGGLHLGIHF